MTIFSFGFCLLLLAEATAQTPLSGVAIHQNTGKLLESDVAFSDESGNRLTIARYLHGPPIILVPVYLRCPMLCKLSLTKIVTALQQTSLRPGRDYVMLVVSFDPTDTPAAARRLQSALCVRLCSAGVEGVHILTSDNMSIKVLLNSLGYTTHRDPVSNEYYHPSVFVTLAPDGRISGYFGAMSVIPSTLRSALVQAGAGKAGSPLDQFILYCFHFNNSEGKYTVMIRMAVRLISTLTLAGLAILVLCRTRRSHGSFN